MDDFIMLAAAMLAAAAVIVTFALSYELVWKPRRQRRIERAHARNKRRSTTG